MKRLIGICVAVAAAAAATACADHGPGYASGGGYAVAVAGCDGYYDDFYGPFDDGCWGDDGAYWYRGADHQYHRDTGGHFSHTAGGAMHAVHGTGPGAGSHFGPAPDDHPHA